MIELLSPVGDFECLKAAVQNGADAVYFGANSFSARAFASNFSLEELKKAILYAKTRGVKTHLTLNTLIKNTEFNDSIKLAKKAYEYGIDAIIVQDIGLARTLIKQFPDLDIHASTQMTIHNYQGVEEAKKLGFKRVVLSRELSLHEIEYICNNSDIEIECFAHGALCISYSGQCLMSSMIGGRSGNRGRCAQPCRLPYSLYENDKKIDNGYLLSTKDLCSLEYIPDLIKAGITSLKIEGRMKNPEYVATVTRIYRKYINLAQSDKTFKIDPQDKLDLLQVFNRGNSSSGHLDNSPNTELVYPEKPNNMGLFLGIIQKYTKNKYITVKLNQSIAIGDTISLEHENSTYNVSELMINNENVKSANVGDIVTIGRMKGKINLGDKIYKISSKSLLTEAIDSYKNENKKIKLKCEVSLIKYQSISIRVTPDNNFDLYKNLDITYYMDTMPVDAKKQPLTKERVIEQISKTNQTPYEFSKIKINMEDNTFLPKFSSINELRRNILTLVDEYVLKNITRKSEVPTKFEPSYNSIKQAKKKPLISVMLNELNKDFNYSELKDIDNIYIPLKFFALKDYSNILEDLSLQFNMYIALPAIIRANYRNLAHNYIAKALNKFNIKGFVLSNISNLLFLEDFTNKKKYNCVANFNFNIFNEYSVEVLDELGLNRFVISPELDKKAILSLIDESSLPTELIVYGKTPVMNINYCLLGKSNKCYPECSANCTKNNNYYIKDRLGMDFTIKPDNSQTVTTIYNSKTLSISPSDFNVNVARIDILDEYIDDINQIVTLVKKGNRLEGKDFTNGNLNRTI